MWRLTWNVRWAPEPGKPQRDASLTSNQYLILEHCGVTCKGLPRRLWLLRGNLLEWLSLYRIWCLRIDLIDKVTFKHLLKSIIIQQIPLQFLLILRYNMFPSSVTSIAGIASKWSSNTTNPALAAN